MSDGAAELKRVYDEGRAAYLAGATARDNPYTLKRIPKFLDPPPEARQILRAQLWARGYVKEQDISFAKRGITI